MSDPHFSLINFLRQNVLLSYGKTNSDNFNEALAIVELADSSLTLLQAVNFQFPVDSVAEPSFLRQGLMRPSSWAVYSMPIQSRLHLASRQWKTQLSRVVTSVSDPSPKPPENHSKFRPVLAPSLQMRTTSDNIILSSVSSTIPDKTTETPIIHAPSPLIQINLTHLDRPVWQSEKLHY